MHIPLSVEAGKGEGVPFSLGRVDVLLSLCIGEGLGRLDLGPVVLGAGMDKLKVEKGEKGKQGRVNSRRGERRER